MAIYSFSAGVFSRSKGHRATAAAAYRAGALIEDHTIGERFDYTRKRGVLHSEILAPEGAPAWMQDRQALWNAVEAQERRSDSQLAREVLLALPHELPNSDQLALVRDFVRAEFVARGMVADLTIHAPSAAGDERNVHAHVMLTLRHIEGDGFGKKARAWNSDELLTHWREAWADHCNTALEEAGFDARVDHRSLEAQGVDRIPGEHKGKATTARERKGQRNERSERREDIERDNEDLSRIVDELAEVNREIAAREERRLDELYGVADPQQPASGHLDGDYPPQEEPEPEPPPQEDRQPGDEASRRLDWFADEMAGAFGESEPGYRWPQEASPEGGASARLDEVVAGFAREIEETGEVGGREGLSWWQRAVDTMVLARDHAVQWVQETWQNFVDMVQYYRDTPGNDDLGR